MPSIWCKLRRALHAFVRAREGNVALTFALAVIPITAAVGAAVDYSHANDVKASLQAALDSTALMISRDAANLSEADLNKHASAYFKALFNKPEATNVKVTATYMASTGASVEIDGQADVPTTFMGIAGYNSITVTGSSTAKWGSSRLRVALVLDNTGSMASDGKMDALKVATKNLLKQLKSAAVNDGDVYVSIIPFSKDVNFGTGWDDDDPMMTDLIDWTAMQPRDSSGNPQVPDSSIGAGSTCPYSSRWGGYSCVTSPGGNRTTSTIPSSVTVNGVTYTGPICQSNSIGCYDSTPHTTSPTTTTYTHTWFVDKSQWTGCITDRGGSPKQGPDPENYDQTVVAPDPTIQASQYPADDDTSNCPPLAMKGLSYDWDGMNTLVTSMQPRGSTNQPIGLVWGWQSLVGGGPLTTPPMDPGYNYQQVIILLSDGLNTKNRWYGNGSSTGTSDDDKIDARMYDPSNGGAGTCANFKNASTDKVKNVIYTIQVNTGGDPTSTLLQNCASSSDKFFLLTSANQIVSAFNTISTKLTKLRVAK